MEEWDLLQSDGTPRAKVSEKTELIQGLRALSLSIEIAVGGSKQKGWVSARLEKSQVKGLTVFEVAESELANLLFIEKTMPAAGWRWDWRKPQRG